jgi:UDP-glucose:(heptosyl)LPS alpha-1,3-glucosyltransferase
VGGDDATAYRSLSSSCGVAHRVMFLGKVLDIESAFLGADVFVMPTAYEAFSVAMIEAAAAGLPLLLTRVNGVQEILKDEQEGLLIERTRGSVAAAVGQVASDANLREKMGNAARKRSEEFSWARIAGRTLEVYVQVNERKRLASLDRSTGPR